MTVEITLFVLSVTIIDVSAIEETVDVACAKSPGTESRAVEDNETIRSHQTSQCKRCMSSEQMEALKGRGIACFKLQQDPGNSEMRDLLVSFFSKMPAAVPLRT